MFKLIGKICMLWWTKWSTLRFKKAIKNNIGIKEEDKFTNIEELKKLLQHWYYLFDWTADGIDQLFDAITPPPQNYQHYLDGGLKDDCDGFHSLVYHVAYNCGFKPYLLTANTTSIKHGHCVLLLNMNNLWYVVDYYNVYGGVENPNDVINEYNKVYSERYKAPKVVFNGLVGYNYNKEKFFVEHLS